MLNEQNIPNTNSTMKPSIGQMGLLSHTPNILMSQQNNNPGSGGATKTFEGFFKSATEDLPTLQVLEKRYIELVLEKTKNRKDKASSILGINRRTLYRKEREYGLVNFLKK